MGNGHVGEQLTLVPEWRKEANRARMRERHHRMKAEDPEGFAVKQSAHGKKMYRQSREKDIEAYRAKKNVYANTPAEKKKRALYQQEWRNRDGNREKHNAWSREWHKKNKKRNKAAQKRAGLKRKYGLTEDSFREMLADQANRCAICFKKLTKTHIDHDHKTGVVRGILCPGCNHFLGQYECRDMAVVEAYLFGLPKKAIA